jgi:uncharacterized protein (DUF608 family)
MAGGAAIGSVGIPMAGPFWRSDMQQHLIPEDKKLSKEWIRSLYERGKPEWLSGDQLQHVGMPVGGICCGQLYIGGDGRLWHWDIFRSDYQSAYGTMSMGIHYAEPMEPERTVKQGFALRVNGKTMLLNQSEDGFKNISFRGEYPVARVRYSDDECPVQAELEAFSPFIPLDHENSGLPLTYLIWKVENRTDEEVEVDLAGWLENNVCPLNHNDSVGQRVNQIVSRSSRTSMICTAEEIEMGQEIRRPIPIADFSSGTYDGWKVEGTAFGDRPLRKQDLADYHNVTGFGGEWFANSHNTSSGETVVEGDAHKGSLTGDPFVINRRYITFKIGGGNHPGETCINLLVDGKVVRSETGHDSNAMREEFFDVTELQGVTAQIQILDDVDGPCGNIGGAAFVQSDEAVVPQLKDLPGYGGMALTVLDGDFERFGSAECGDLPVSSFVDAPDADVKYPFSRKPIGSVGATIKLGPNETKEVRFTLTWYFPNYPNVTGEFSAITDIHELKRHYAAAFKSIKAITLHAADQSEELITATRNWNRTWYDSTLPHWLLDRSFIPIDCLATQTCHWFDNDRFYGWEGVTCCPGTCQHVWNYAQGLARIFPDLERRTREHIDYGLSFTDSGMLWYRGESAKHIATDGQCGTIIRAYREHTTQPDSGYLSRIYPRLKKSIEHLIEQDGGKDGVLEGDQYNTLDQAWHGPMGWISSMYLAALKVGEMAAREMGDGVFSTTCRTILERGNESIVDQTFNGEMFIHHPPDFVKTNTNKGCHIDQVFGQSLAWQVGLDRVVPAEETAKALRSIWKYNFAPDAGGYRNLMQDTIKGGRWYAMEGEAGLLMSSWPHGGADKAKGSGKVFEVGVGYFNECMNGFEYQAASHMIYEAEPGSDLVEKGLAVTKAVHDRYSADRRNPYNEIECSDHYSRSMASYGVFLACCGFSYHGPKGEIGFAPRVSPEDFRAPFTAAEGWGTYSQKIDGEGVTAKIAVTHGELAVWMIRLAADADSVSVTLDGEDVIGFVDAAAGGVVVRLSTRLRISAGQVLTISLK